MLSLCESEVLQEYINKPRSEMTEAEKRRIKYASIKKREQMRKAAKNYQVREMIPLKDYQKLMAQVKRQQMNNKKQQSNNKNAKSGGRK